MISQWSSALEVFWQSRAAQYLVWNLIITVLGSITGGNLSLSRRSPVTILALLLYNTFLNVEHEASMIFATIRLRIAFC